MSSSAFSFHCMICFEEFDPTNYPVVLPCGHTYVCVNCAKRIDKCMECRAPLIAAPPPPPPPPVSTSPSRSYNSYSYSPRPQRQRPQPWYMREAEAADQRQRERERQQQQQQVQQQTQQQQQQQMLQQQQQSSIKNKHRLPLPKNVVLLSLIQASEPARRRTTLLAAAEMTPSRAAVDTETETTDDKQHSTEAAESPQKKQAVTEEDDDEALLEESPPSSAPRSSRHSQSKNIVTLPDAPSSLLSFNNFIINNNKEEEEDDDDDSSNNTEKQEDLKIQMGIGACTGVSGTYAVIDKNGILVFRTLVDLDLFEKKRRRKRMMVGVDKEEGEQGRMLQEEEGGVEGERVQLKQEQEQIQEEEDVNVVEDDDKSVATAIVSKLSRVFHSLLSFDDTVDGSGSDDSSDHNDGTTAAAAEIPGEGRGGEASFPVMDQQKPSDSLGLTLSTSTSTMNALADGDCQDDGTNSNNNNTMMNELDTASSSGLYGSDILSLHEKPSLSFGLSSVASSTICHGSWDVKQSVDSPKKTYNIAVETDRTRSLTETSLSVQERRHPSESEDKKINRQGGDGGGNDKSECEEGKTPPSSSVAVAPSVQEDEGSTFEGSFIRLKYGDRVQVVSFDPRGWVKLARGYGYISLQNDEQLVKVGGPNDKACHIEATLHELSIERDRLKREQIKLERLSAGLMIDLQSTLLSTSDDHVITPAPKGFLRMSDSDSCGEDTNDGIAVEISGEAVEITTTPTSSPRNDTFHQVQTDRSLSPNTRITPTREVNWKTGLSGHMALSSPFTSSSATTYSHPHDFIAATSGGTTRSMSNHSGASTPKSKSRKSMASIY